MLDVAITDAHSLHSWPEGDDLTSRIGAWNTTRWRAPASLSSTDEQVAVIERDCTHANEHLSGTGRGRLRPFNESKSINTVRRVNLNTSHKQ